MSDKEFGDYDHRIGWKQRKLLFLMHELPERVEGKKWMESEANKYGMTVMRAMKSSDPLKALADRGLITKSTYHSPRNIDLSEHKPTPEGERVAKEVAKELIADGRVDMSQVSFNFSKGDKAEITSHQI